MSQIERYVDVFQYPDSSRVIINRRAMLRLIVALGSSVGLVTLLVESGCVDPSSPELDFDPKVFFEYFETHEADAEEVVTLINNDLGGQFIVQSNLVNGRFTTYHRDSIAGLTEEVPCILSSPRYGCRKWLNGTSTGYQYVTVVLLLDNEEQKMTVGWDKNEWTLVED